MPKKTLIANPNHPPLTLADNLDSKDLHRQWTKDISIGETWLNAHFKVESQLAIHHSIDIKIEELLCVFFSALRAAWRCKGDWFNGGVIVNCEAKETGYFSHSNNTHY